MQKPREELAKLVKVTANVTAAWDGKSYDLSKGVNIALGVAEFWRDANSSVIFAIEEVASTPIPNRSIENPLEANDRGEAFAGLKRGRKPKEGE